MYRLKEYLNGQVQETMPDGTTVMKLHIVEQEQWWIGILLSLGDMVEIISPEAVRTRIIEQAEKVLNLYKNI